MLNLKIIIRNLFKRKLSTSFTLISFTIAFCCCTLVYLFVQDEFAFDKYNTNFENIYRLNKQAKDKSVINCSFPGVYYDNLSAVSGTKEYARLATFLGDRNISIDQKPFIENSFLFGDPGILNILDFDFVVGNPNEALAKPLSVILTKSKAEKYFGEQNPIGKIIRLDNHDFSITGVVHDLPEQSHISMNFLASVSSYQIINKDLLTKWYMTAFNYYFLIPEKGNNFDIENQLADIYAAGNNINDKKREFGMYLEPLGDIHLKSVGTRWDNVIKGDINVVYGLIAVVLLILGIAITNFINILTAEYQRKIKESGIRRINGAPKTVLALEQILETLILLTLSIIISTLLAQFLLPYINALSEKTLEITFSLLRIVLILLFSSTIISAVYPILFFNSFNPSEAIKSKASILKVKGKKKQQIVRGSLVIFQLGIATLLIVSTIVINNQLQLVLKTKTGFDKENTLIVKNPYGGKMNSIYKLFKAELLKIPSVKSVGVAQNAPGGSVNNYSPARLPEQKKEEGANIGQITVDHDFLNTIGAQFVEGRNFNPDITTDKKSGIVINQSAVKTFNLTNPIGSKLVGINNAYTPNNELEVIGVIEDMQYFTLRENAKPIMYYIREWSLHNIAINLEKGDYSDIIASIESAWKEVAPELPFSFQFMDDRISANYRSEINTAKVVSSLSIIAIFLSMLGIFGMIAFTIQHRTKEIGIRKVNGAKVSEILTMLNGDFIKWVAIAFVIACPIAYFAMNLWLENFAYKTSLSWWIFALAGVLALGIALLTVLWQSWRAATRNPVEALRYE